VTLAGDGIVGRIQAYPPKIRKQRFNPGMGCVRSRTILVLDAMVEITTHITTWNSEAPSQSDHDMRKILTDALSILEGF
jgi:hypothetical protein